MAAYSKYCHDHFVELDTFCGLVKEKNTVIVAGRCPFCLIRYTKGWHIRVKEWTDWKQLTEHLHEHIACIGSPGREPICPHPLCERVVYGSICELLDHFCDAHGIDKRKIQKLYLEFQTETSLVNFTDAGPLQVETDAETTMVGLTINNSLAAGETGLESPTDYSLLGACLPPLLGDVRQH